MVWTDEVVEQLKIMWDKGMTTGQIAKELNVTKNSIIGKVHRLCLTARPSPIKKKEATKEEVKNTENNKDKNKTKETSEAKKIKTNEKQNTPKPIKASNKATKVPAKQQEVATKDETRKEETNIPLVKLDSHTCRWPLGDPKDDDFCFCGKKIKLGQTYCDEHSLIAYVKPNKR